jgi:hypothetical protein
LAMERLIETQGQRIFFRSRRLGDDQWRLSPLLPGNAFITRNHSVAHAAASLHAYAATFAGGRAAVPARPRASEALGRGGRLAI